MSANQENGSGAKHTQSETPTKWDPVTCDYCRKNRPEFHNGLGKLICYPCLNKKRNAKT